MGQSIPLTFIFFKMVNNPLVIYCNIAMENGTFIDGLPI